MAITQEQMKDIYLRMQKIRVFESKAKWLLTENKIPGFAHLYIGEEAVASAVCEALRDDDYITSTHRGHGHLIAKGGDMKYMMAELYGRYTGYCKGKGGSMHIADSDIGILGANGIVGAGMPIGVGAGLSAKVRGTDQVAVTFFGDGASNHGTFHESMNMAALWKLPVIFVCENNGYQITVPQARHQSIKDVSCRAGGYGIPGVTIDGNDALAVYETASVAVARARAGEGPTLIECKTYRHGGHFSGDPGLYRPPEEVAAWLKKDPIPRFAKYMIENGVATEDELNAIVAQVEKEVEAACDFAAAQPFPADETTVDDVYTNLQVKEARVR